MPEGPPIDDDILSLLERTRAHSAEPPREHIARATDRRVAERRALGLAGRRSFDVEVNRNRRAFLFLYLSRLSRERLLRWIDGLWLGIATDAQLAMLVDSAGVDQQADDARRRSPKRKRGRPKGQPSASDDDLRATWRTLQRELKNFSRARHNHFNQSKQKPPKGRHPTDFRRACRKSPIGRRVDASRLFTTFFDDPALGPGVMAAMLMHREIKQHWKTFEQAERVTSRTADSVRGRDRSRQRAQQAAAVVKQFPSWRTMYKKLRQPARR